MRQPLPSHIAAPELEDAYPLSGLQQGMLFNTLREPGSGVDIVQLVTTLHEGLDVEALKQAWRRVIERHGVLRTGFRWQGVGEPRQEVRREVELPWSEHDLRELQPMHRDEHIKAFLDAERCRGFDLACPPLFRVALLRFAEEDFRLVVTFHHAILDGRSYVLTILEVFRIYEALRRGQTLELPMPRPYRAYIRWLLEQDFSGSEAFWRTMLHGMKSPTPIFIDHRPGTQAYDGSRKGIHEARLPADVTSALRRFAQDNGSTLNTIVIGAWALLLGRYSGEAEVVFGVVRANRRSCIEGADAVVGPFINTLPMRVRVDAGRALPALLSDIRSAWNALQAHEHTPLARVHAWSEMPPHAPLFDTTVVFENYLMGALFRKLDKSWSRRDSAGFMQTIYAAGLGAYDGDELTLRLDYDRARIDDESAARMLGHVRNVLQAFARDPSRAPAEISLLSPPELEQLRVWNGTHHPVGVEALHQLFERQAGARPDAVAAVFREATLTYGALDAQASALAAQLRALGVGPGALVGVAFERSLEMLVALIAVVKAGAAYLPLDPNYPAARLTFMLRDARPQLVLAEERLRERLRAADACIVTRAELAAGKRRPLAGQRVPPEVAYVIYTSGSTGEPNGVQVTHRALVNLLLSMQREPGITSHDTLLALTTLSFDISALELFLPLISGARVVIADAQTARDGPALAALMQQSGVTVMQATPATWRLLLDGGWQGSPKLKVLCGGEAWTSELADRLLPRCASLWNMYGPTETTIWSAVGRIEAGKPITIGLPVANTTLHVLDADGQVAPVGVPGELHIGGIGLALGYLNRTELTKARFIDQPLHAERAGRVYKTGDRVRRLPDGRLEFLGRADEQIKLRGFRIEPAEIEAAIAGHDGVRSVAVIAREDIPGDKRLVAYLAGPQGSRERLEALRVRLGERLPHYMQPAAFVFLDELPLSANGKVDRKALPAPEPSAPDGASAGEPARTDLERALVAAWAKVLGVQQIGIHDNFFALGGDSLAAVKLTLEMEQATGIDISVGQVFDTPTVADLAANLGSKAKEYSLVVPLADGADEVPIFCLLGINLYADFARSLAGCRVFGVYVPEEESMIDQFLRGKPYAVSIEKLADAYYQAILRFRREGPYRLAGLSLGGIVAMEVARKLRAGGAQVDLVVLFDSWLPHGLRRRWWPWFRHEVGGALRRWSTRWRARLQSRRSHPTSIVSALRQDAFVTAIRRWQALQRDFDFPVLLFRALDRRAWGGHVDFASDYGWRRLVSERLSVVDVDGDHISMLQKPHVITPAREVRRHLAADGVLESGI